jgi:hypothetical protein
MKMRACGMQMPDDIVLRLDRETAEDLYVALLAHAGA